MDYLIKEDVVEHFFRIVKGLIIPSKENNYKSRFLQSNTLLYCVIFVLILKITTTLIFINIPPNTFFADITKAALENFVNQTRQSLGLRSLTENEKLNLAAQAKAEHMVQYQYFSHTSPNGVSPWFWFVQAGYNYKYAGENLAIGFFDSQEVYQAWLDSPSHRENIVNPNYTEVGTAVVKGFGQGNTIIVVQEFGSPKIAKPVATKPQPQPQVQPQPQPQPQPQVQPEPIAENIVLDTGEQVLSQMTESQGAIELPNNTAKNNLKSRITNFILYDYDKFLQEIIYGISLLVIGILFAIISSNFNFNFKKQLIIRAGLILLLLITASLVDKDIAILLVPHQIQI